MDVTFYWATEYYGIANSFGYAVHNQRARDSLLKEVKHWNAFWKNGKVVPADSVEKAPLVFSVSPADKFRPFPGKRNILYTAWEFEELPPSVLEGMRRADVVVLTARFLVDLISRFLPEKKMHYCPLGVDVVRFRYRKRKYSEPFRYLWVGAPNTRKGWELVRDAWIFFSRDPSVELYIKTTSHTRQRKIRAGNLIWDSRRVSADEFVRIYQRAHSFLFPALERALELPSLRQWLPDSPR